MQQTSASAIPWAISILEIVDPGRLESKCLALVKARILHFVDRERMAGTEGAQKKQKNLFLTECPQEQPQWQDIAKAMQPFKINRTLNSSAAAVSLKQLPAQVEVVLVGVGLLLERPLQRGGIGINRSSQVRLIARIHCTG